MDSPYMRGNPSKNNCTGVHPTFSIIIPTYNRSEQVCRAIRSCLAQSFRSFEVIVIDDGSTDETRERVTVINDERVFYYRQTNEGAAAARNHGAEMARGQFLAFLDSDDEFSSDKLEVAAARVSAETATNSTVWYSRLSFHRGHVNALVKPARPIAPGEPVGDYLFADDGLIQTSTIIIHRAAFLKVQFDPSLRSLQDIDLCVRLQKHGFSFKMFPEALTVWHNGDDGERISHGSSRNAETWIASNRSNLSDVAYHGFVARFIALRNLPNAPIKSTTQIVRAVRYGAVGKSRATTLMVKGLAPGFYSSVRDAVVSALGWSRIIKSHS